MREDERHDECKPHQDGRARVEQPKQRICKQRGDAGAEQVDWSSSQPIGQRAADRDRDQRARGGDQNAVQDGLSIESNFPND